ncbi:hypothetical protein LINPERPRIM_LOCUS5489 [Linum perenne]
MVQKLEAIKGGGGSIKVGTTGTISNLITRELESAISSPQASNPPRDLKLGTDTVSVPCSATSPRRLQARKPTDEASSSSSRNNIRCSETAKKEKHQAKGSHRVPMLAGDGVTLERTPSREKKNRRVVKFVEVVDVKCGTPGTPLTSKLKKLGFSKLSEGMV